jgi:hypothetical protein
MKPLLLFAALLQAIAAEPLVGRWDVESRSRGGLGTWTTLSADHTCTETTGAMVDGTWQLTRDRLIRKVPEGPGGNIQTEELTIAVADGALTMRVGPNTRQLTRVGPPATRKPALVGVWSYPHPAGGTAYEDFEPDGRYLFRLPMTSMSCTWRADPMRLQLIMNQQAQSFRWSLDGTRLTLERDGKHEVFHRETAVLAVTAPSSRR